LQCAKTIESTFESNPGVDVSVNKEQEQVLSLLIRTIRICKA